MIFRYFVVHMSCIVGFMVVLVFSAANETILNIFEERGFFSLKYYYAVNPSVLMNARIAHIPIITSPKTCYRNKNKQAAVQGDENAVSVFLIICTCGVFNKNACRRSLCPHYLPYIRINFRALIFAHPDRPRTISFLNPCKIF